MEYIKLLIKSNVFGTVISGVIVFIAGQLFIEYFLNPIQEYKKLKSKIAYSLVYNANRYNNPIEPESKNKQIWSKSSDDLRGLAAEVLGFAELKPIINFFIPQKKKLKEVSSCLMGLSNSCFQTSTCLDQIIINSEQEKKIKEILNLI